MEPDDRKETAATTARLDLGESSVRMWRWRGARSSHNAPAVVAAAPGRWRGKQLSSERSDVGEGTHDNAAGAPEIAGSCRGLCSSFSSLSWGQG